MREEDMDGRGVVEDAQRVAEERHDGKDLFPSRSAGNNPVLSHRRKAHNCLHNPTQLRFSTSCSVRPMVGNAGATMVCSSAERNMASRMPTMIAQMAVWGSGIGG